MRYNDRKRIFDSTKRLRGKKITITEGLTVTRMKKLNGARERYNLKTISTSDGKILCKDESVKMKTKLTQISIKKLTFQ